MTSGHKNIWSCALCVPNIHKLSAQRILESVLNCLHWWHFDIFTRRERACQNGTREVAGKSPIHQLGKVWVPLSLSQVFELYPRQAWSGDEQTKGGCSDIMATALHCQRTTEIPGRCKFLQEIFPRNHLSSFSPALYPEGKPKLLKWTVEAPCSTFKKYEGLFHQWNSPSFFFTAPLHPQIPHYFFHGGGCLQECC